MRITIIEDPDTPETDVTIRCRTVDREVAACIARLRMADAKLTGTKDGETRIVDARDVLYVESVDRTAFLYLADDILASALGFGELEERLTSAGFLRVQRSCLVNFDAVTALKPAGNGRLMATLSNGEQLVISRAFVPSVRRRLGM